MTQYYYLVSSLVEIALDEDYQKHPYPVFKDFVREELSETDYADLRKCFLFNDVLNIVSALRPVSSGANTVHIEPSYYDADTIVEGLIDPEIFFPFLSDFIWDYRNDRRMYPGISEENELLHRMLAAILVDEESPISGFPRYCLEFEIHLRNFTTALSGRLEGHLDPEMIISFDDFSEKIASSQAVDFSLGGEMGVLASLVDIYGNATPLEIEKAITAARWQWLDEAVGCNLFSREAVFAYAVKIADIERWLSLTPEAGRIKLDKLLNQLHQDIKKMTQEENAE